MRNTIKVPFGVYYYEQFCKPIRGKQDVVSFVLYVVNLLIIGKEEGYASGTIWIKKEKMNRVFCFMEKKYFSTVFPFDIEWNRAEENRVKVYDPVFDMEIDLRKSVLLERMLKEIDFKKKTVDSVIESAYLDVAEDGYTNEEVDKCFGLIMRLMSMELGYIRYDYDPEHENGNLHPLHHLDINYSSKGTYKLGMNEKINEDDFVDMLDIKTECRYVQ